MRKFCCFLLIFAFFDFVLKPQEVCYSKTQTRTYAKVLKDCVFYKSSEMLDDFDDVFFILPESYFVVVLDEVANDCLKVQYDKFIGYVHSVSVDIVSFVPVVKTLENIFCDVKKQSGTQIWNGPSTQSRVLTTISAGVCDVKYIAFAYGTIPVGGESNLWYYVSYTPEFNSTNVYEGYVYSENMTNLSDIVFNHESNIQVKNDDNADIIFVSSSMKTILVVLISLPIIVLILIILYKLSKKLRKNTNKTNFENNKSYDECINQSDLNYNETVNKNYENLKSKINSMKNTKFFRKLKNDSPKSYPDFPAYDSDDDWL